MKKPNVKYAITAMYSGIAALPVAAYFNMVLGLAMLSLPLLLIYHASGE